VRYSFEFGVSERGKGKRRKEIRGRPGYASTEEGEDRPLSIFRKKKRENKEVKPGNEP